MRARPFLLYPLALAYFVFGLVHLTTPSSLTPLMPAWVPAPNAVILFTGACEIAGAVGLTVPRLRSAAAVMLALYALCVWPANIHHALSGAHVKHVPDSWWYHGPRLALQPLIIWLPLYAAGLTSWPFRRA
jgi:uncharacterized membrane protein